MSRVREALAVTLLNKENRQHVGGAAQLMGWMHLPLRHPYGAALQSFNGLLRRGIWLWGVGLWGREVEDGLIAIVAVGLMAAGGTGSAGLSFGKANRYRPATERYALRDLLLLL